MLTANLASLKVTTPKRRPNAIPCLRMNWFNFCQRCLDPRYEATSHSGQPAAYNSKCPYALGPWIFGCKACPDDDVCLRTQKYSWESLWSAWKPNSRHKFHSSGAVCRSQFTAWFRYLAPADFDLGVWPMSFYLLRIILIFVQKYR